MSEQPDAVTSFAGLRAMLAPKEQQFVDEYVECWNATLAARRVWRGKHAAKQGYDVARRPNVAAAIDAGLREQRERTHNDPDRIIRQIMELAYADPRDLVDGRGNLLPLHQLAPEIRRAVTSVRVLVEKVETDDVVGGAEGQAPDSTKRVTTRTRVVEYRLAAKTPALELLGKRLKMFTDRLELDASDSLSALIKQSFNRPAPAIAPEADA